MKLSPATEAVIEQAKRVPHEKWDVGSWLEVVIPMVIEAIKADAAAYAKTDKSGYTAEVIEEYNSLRQSFKQVEAERDELKAKVETLQRQIPGIGLKNVSVDYLKNCLAQERGNLERANAKIEELERQLREALPEKHTIDFNMAFDNVLATENGVHVRYPKLNHTIVYNHSVLTTWLSMIDEKRESNDA